MSVLHWPTFFFTFVICGALLYVFIALRLSRKEKKPRHYINNNELSRIAKTGDLLVVAYPSKSGKLVKVFTGSRWTHCAFIVKDSNESSCDEDSIRVIEIAQYRHRSGVINSSLEDWLYKHRRCTVLYRPLIYDINTSVLRDASTFLDVHKDCKPDMNAVNWLKTMKRTAYHRKSVKCCYYCSEFVIRFLQYEGVVKTLYDPACYKPREIAYGSLHWKDGYYHGTSRLYIHDDYDNAIDE